MGYESTLNMTESRYRDAVNREKSKLATITSENDQLRKIISSNDYRSPGIGTLTSTVEGHLSRFTSKVDELRQDLSAPRVSATPRSQAPPSRVKVHDFFAAALGLRSHALPGGAHCEDLSRNRHARQFSFPLLPGASPRRRSLSRALTFFN